MIEVRDPRSGEWKKTATSKSECRHLDFCSALVIVAAPSATVTGLDEGQHYQVGIFIIKYHDMEIISVPSLRLVVGRHDKSRV